MSEAAQINRDQVKDFLKNMSLMEAAALVKELEQELGVSAAAPVAVAAAGPAAGAAAPAPEKDEFTVMLTGSGGKKIQVIKVVRELTRPGPQGGQGFGRRRSQGGQGRGHQGRSGRGAEEVGGRGRHSGAEVGSRIQCNLNFAQLGWRQRQMAAPNGPVGLPQKARGTA